MKFALFLLAVLPFVMSASVDEKRFIESLLGGYDIVDLAKQILNQFGNDETEAQCENELCPQLLNPIDGNNALITDITCSAVCKEVQVLAQHYGTGN